MIYRYLVTLVLLCGTTGWQSLYGAEVLRDSLPAPAVVELLDGQLVEGLLLRREDDGTAVMYMADGSLVKYKPDELKRVRLKTTETGSAERSTGEAGTELPDRPAYEDPARYAPKVTPIETDRRPVFAPDKWNFRADLHSLSGASKTVGFNLTVGIHLKVLRRLNEQLLLGGGLGWDLYAPSSGEETYPLYGSVYYYPGIASNHLYTFANLGYGLAFTDELLEVYEAEGGPMGHVGIGTHLFPRSGHRIGVEIGYKTQDARFARINSNQDFEVRDLRYQRITLGIWAQIFRKKEKK